MSFSRYKDFKSSAKFVPTRKLLATCNKAESADSACLRVIAEKN